MKIEMADLLLKMGKCKFFFLKFSMDVLHINTAEVANGRHS